MTQRRTYRVTSPSVDEINFVFSQMADRLDQMEGYRGTPLFKASLDLGGNAATNAGSATDLTDLTQLQQVQDVLKLNKPIGTIHMSVNPANPATYLFYGTWVAYGAGRVVIGVDSTDTDFDTVEETGGAKTAAVSSHTHSLPDHTHAPGTVVQLGVGVTVNDGASGVGVSGGGTGTISIIQPYITVFIWKRTA